MLHLKQSYMELCEYQVNVTKYSLRPYDVHLSILSVAILFPHHTYTPFILILSITIKHYVGCLHYSIAGETYLFGNITKKKLKSA